MLEFILQSNKSNFEKIEELKKITTESFFLDVLESPGAFLDEIIPFAAQIFKDLPPDSAMTFGQSNDMRVFFMRLLSKLKYKNYSNSFLLELIYELIQTENIFNRYLSLKILFPLLDSDIHVNYERHLKCLSSFFRNELPVSDGLDNSRCELGFFAVSEVLNYLNSFQKKYNLPVEYYDEIICLMASALRLYFTQKHIEKFCLSKKVVCEFCSMGINLIKFINLVNIPINHFICALIPDLSYTLVNISPSDCYHLRRDILKTILNTFHVRKDLVYNIDRYFLKNLYLHTDYEPLQILNLYFLSELVKGCVGISKIVHFEFDQRICEYLPIRKALPLLHSCIYALSINFTNALKVPMEQNEMRMMVNRHIKIAHKIYTLLHLPISNVNNNINNDFISPSEYFHKDIMALYSEDDDGVSNRFIEYLKILIKSCSFLQLQNKPFEREQIIILGNLLLFPLTRELPCTDYLYLFNEIHPESLEKIILCIVDSLFIKYYSQVYSWVVLLNVPEISCIFIKAANALIHHDITQSQFRSLDFYQKILPLAYWFFKIDKKYIKSEFSEYFSVIYDYLLHTDLKDISNNANDYHLTLRDAVGLLNTMFLEVKNCDIAYTGLYFIYNYFEVTVKELYNAYTLTFDTFYLEALFNIPVSLNLLVTKYAVLLNAMSAGLHANKKIRDIIIKYIEYIVEFDSEEGLMDNLLLNIYGILQSSFQSSGTSDMNFSKGINVFSRISNRHREVLTCGTLHEHIPDNSENILCSISFGGSRKEECMYVEDSHYVKQDIEAVLKILKTKEANNIDNGNLNNIDSIKDSLSIPCNKLRRLNIPLVAGYEFIYEYDIRKNPYQGSSSRILKAYDIDLKTVSPDFCEYVKDSLIRYLLDLLKMEYSSSTEFNNSIDDNDNTSINDNTTNAINDMTVIYQSASDVLFSLLLLGEKHKNLSVMDFMKWFIFNCSSLLRDSRVLYDFIPDGLIYAPNITFTLLEFMQENVSFSAIILNTIYALIDFIYSKNDLKSDRAIDVLNNLVETKIVLYAYLNNNECNGFNNNFTDQKLTDNSLSNALGNGSPKSAFLIDMFCAVLFKTRKCISFRVYQLSLKITQEIGKILLQSESPASSLFRNTLEKPTKSECFYFKALVIEMCSFFNFSCPIEQIPEMDKRCILRILEINPNSLLKINNLPTVAENFLKSIDKKDTYSIEKYLGFLFKMKYSRSLFNDLLSPAKKYLPAIAVLEGFSSEDARHKFVESVNKNGNFQSQNPNSFRIFRNLFHKCNVSTAIKTNFIEVYASQTKEHRSVILDIILNSLEYDLPSFDFLISKLIELPLLRNDGLVGLTQQGIEIFNILSIRIFEQPMAIQESLIMYLIEHIHNDFVYQFVDLCIPIDNDIAHVLTNFLNDFLNNNHSYREQLVFSKAAYNILRYLRRRKCRFNDNKAVLLVYRDLHSIENEIESLVNWYFKNFSVEDIELLYRINTGFLITSESLLLKLIGVESLSTRNWMIDCFHKQNISLINTNNINASNNNLNDVDVSFLKKCVAFYLRSKGIPVPDPLLQNNFKVFEKFSKPDYISELPRFSPETIFVYAGEQIESSESENSLFFEEESVESESIISSKSNAIDDKKSNNGGVNNSNEKNNVINDKSIDVIEHKTFINRSVPSHSIMFPSNSSISLTDISFLLPYFSDSLHLIIDLFCDLKIFSKELLEKCKEIVHNSVSIRYSALYYLCLFEPSIEYFESIFKLNYQERKYVFPSLQLLVERFGVSSFVNSIKTVLRSEMRFRTIKYILVPFLCSNLEFLENSEILFELCVFSHRLVRIGYVDRSLIKIILSSNNVSDRFKQELSTLIAIQEITNNKAFIGSHISTNVYLRNSTHISPAGVTITNIHDTNNIVVGVNSLNLKLLQELNSIYLLDLLDIALSPFSLSSPSWFTDILSCSSF
ncbi:atypical/PIKK/TRRAP protein kinase [Vittaforma corneae ATCC 50505]|uniref:Atypical/PIKK/TRRAP protein kinase n=1 Tax=Vittaforma corneae (strain ATCC 50505) TaxID=993615 RepID=L2GN04_VITCO|nr:atypical/PIKK/TRRAP protein kinase [Vittaforma corneae ATCC 50505]ELA42278.1 atypical/PIKK/TRRAP protein kinase [Vittaforma corneae ATCC 50505]